MSPNWADRRWQPWGWRTLFGQSKAKPNSIAGDAFLAAKAFQNDADLVLGRKMPPCGTANVPDGLLAAVSSALAAWSHRPSYAATMSQKLSLIQSGYSVQQVLTAYTVSVGKRRTANYVFRSARPEPA
jgi:hypothetical protein